MELFSFIFFVHSHLKYKINNHYPCELMSLQNIVQITDAYPLSHAAYYYVLGAAQIRASFL